MTLHQSCTMEHSARNSAAKSDQRQVGKIHFSIRRHSVEQVYFAIIITNLNTVYALHVSVAKGGA